jgi:NAD(P)-dependent dehydrogenase (short-subunit alcohol dehydrogenase family)
VLLTGATSGIGLAAVERFAREGADLALVSRGESALAEAAGAARAHGATAHVFPADLTDRTAAETTVRAAVDALGGLDVVVSNSGAVAFGHVLEVAPEDFDRTVATTFTAAVNVVRAALPALRASRGVVVATSSIMARMPLPAFASYTAAKHALRASDRRPRGDGQPRSGRHRHLRARDERHGPAAGRAARRLPPGRGGGRARRCRRLAAP